MSSQITHTHNHQKHPLAHILDTYVLIFSRCAIFTDYQNRIMSQHPTPPQVIITRAREVGQKEHWAKQKGHMKRIQLHRH